MLHEVFYESSEVFEDAKRIEASKTAAFLFYNMSSIMKEDMTQIEQFNILWPTCENFSLFGMS